MCEYMCTNNAPFAVLFGDQMCWRFSGPDSPTTANATERSPLIQPPLAVLVWLGLTGRLASCSTQLTGIYLCMLNMG